MAVDAKAALTLGKRFLYSTLSICVYALELFVSTSQAHLLTVFISVSSFHFSIFSFLDRPLNPRSRHDLPRLFTGSLPHAADWCVRMLMTYDAFVVIVCAGATVLRRHGFVGPGFVSCSACMVICWFLTSSSLIR